MRQNYVRPGCGRGMFTYWLPQAFKFLCYSNKFDQEEPSLHAGNIPG